MTEKTSTTSANGTENVTYTRETKRYSMKSTVVRGMKTITLKDKKTGVEFTKQTRSVEGFNFARVGKTVYIWYHSRIWHGTNETSVTDYSPFWSYFFTKGYMKNSGGNTSNYNEFVSRYNQTMTKQKEGKMKFK